MIATVAISLFLGLLAAAALLSTIASVRRGIAGARSILRELGELEAGRLPAPPVRTMQVRHPTGNRVSPLRPVRPQIFAPHCAAA
ncbi:hypothetical protein M3P36_09345 [Altererythrobacter sp. KTW20L]|uniref:hypothetical protein n=1 Tax=Altererythrobacter sp. KTW20L TaxID=2942210 RepID=UPI0020C109C0|nr:hypothetical protein [Altererythrobacter sp. KTW20L]MCL6251242.1 hypothetical protein [Altererythrobacter sp. KTW20L]